MALIPSFEPSEPERDSVRPHEPAPCTYFTFMDPHGAPYLQLNTYGSPHRKYPDKVSQTIQLDVSGMKALARILQETLETYDMS